MKGSAAGIRSGADHRTAIIGFLAECECVILLAPFRRSDLQWITADPISGMRLSCNNHSIRTLTKGTWS
jgi:hypothetical protein